MKHAMDGVMDPAREGISDFAFRPLLGPHLTTGRSQNTGHSLPQASMLDNHAEDDPSGFP